MVSLLPHDADARRLSRQAFLLGEFLERSGYSPPALPRKAVVHGHCHHRAIVGMTGDRSIFEKLGMDYRLLDSGCCGMAGAFGFEREHYDVSIACGERVLLPSVRQADHETLIVADGFSCREQIAQTTDRRALHLAEIVQMAIRRDHPTREL